MGGCSICIWYWYITLYFIYKEIILKQVKSHITVFAKGGVGQIASSVKNEFGVPRSNPVGDSLHRVGKKT